MIDRRSLALGLSALLPIAAVAQQASPNAATPPADLGRMAPGQLARLVHDAGAFSLMTARVGQEKAGHAEVKRFAQFEIIEQENVAEALRLAAHAFPAPSFGGEKAAVLDRLRAMPPGEAFDSPFLESQAATHQELLNLTAAMMARNNAPAPDRILAILSNGQIKEHLIQIGALLAR